LDNDVDILEKTSEISDVPLNDEMGAPKAIWLLNIEREEKKKRKRAQI